MSRIRLMTLAGAFLMCASGFSAVVVDTLKGTSDVQDCAIYSYADCDAEASGENCQRYNGGNVYNLGTGYTATDERRRTLIMLPGWDGTVPDSSEFKVYCKLERDTQDRTMLLYPVTTRWYEGEEVQNGVGDYPDPDSGATWLHAYLDVGDGDSVNWTSGGGDYITDIACSTIVTDTGQYFTFRNFNRILNYWDTSGSNYGFILMMANEFPVNYSDKVIRSTKYADNTTPIAIIYNTGPDAQPSRRRRMIMTNR